MTSSQPTAPTENKDTSANGGGTEADAKGGKVAARDAAERDWQDSAKETGS